MTITNGANHHSVEDLLSSIRTSINDEPIGMRQGPSSPMPSRRESALGDDNAEFELPAIFKPSHQQPQIEKPNNLFGRLSDAMKSAAEPDRSRTVIRFEPAGGRMIEPPAPLASVVKQNPQPQVVHSSRTEQVVDPVQRALKDTSPVRREMPSFFDTRINRLGELTRDANTPKQPEPPQPVAQVPQPPPLRHPMVQAAADDTPAAASSGMEDAAAQLLRPILKQWLTDNMPKIVEKALRSEAGEDFSQPNNTPNGRKPGTLR